MLHFAVSFLSVIAKKDRFLAPTFFLPFPPRNTTMLGFLFLSSVDRLMHLFCPLYRRSCRFIPWFFGTPLLFPLTVVVLFWTSFSLRFLCHLCLLGFELLSLCASLLSPILFSPHVVLLSP